MNNKLKTQVNKNFLQKYLFTIILSMVICSSAFFAQDFRNPPDLQVSIQPGIAYKAGSIGEHLFNMDGYGMPVDFAPSGGKQISFLQWDINAMLEATLDVDFQYKAFLAKVNGRVGLPMKAGKMDDFDWNSSKGHQTHFSTHTNKITSHFALGALVGWELSSEDRHIQFIPMVGFSWLRTSMVAVDGYRQYVPDKLQPTTPWTPDIEKKYFDGEVISYRHEVLQVDCVFRITYNHNSKFYVHLDGSVHPIVAAYGYDTHILRNLQFLDHNMKGELGFGAAITFGYQIMPKHFLTLRVDYNNMPVVTGKTYMKSVNQQYYYPDSSSMGGASHWFVGVTLGWKFNLFS